MGSRFRRSSLDSMSEAQSIGIVRWGDYWLDDYQPGGLQFIALRKILD